MPMRPVREDVYDTAPMRPMNIRSGYEGYRRTIDRRREVIRTERPVSRRVNSRKGKKERTSGRTRYENRNSLSALIARQRSAAGKEQYFDYDLLFVHGFRKTANGGFIGSSQRSAREGEKLCTALPLVQYPGTHKAGGAGN